MSKIVLTEEAGVPSTPAAGKWTLYTKAGGLYYLDDAGSEIGPLSALTKAAYTDVATGTDDAKYVTSLAIKNSVNVPNVAPSTSGNVLTSNGTAWTSVIPSLSANDLSVINGKIVPTVASNNLTLSLKTFAGTDPSATDPIYVTIGSTVRAITSALSVTKNAGTNWFNAGSAELATKEIDYFVYIGYNATDGVTLGFSRIPYGAIYSNFSTTTTNEKYCAISTITNAASSDTYINIGRFSAFLTAGAGYTWSVPTYTNSSLIQRPIFSTRWLSWIPVITAETGSLTSYTLGTNQYQIDNETMNMSFSTTITNAGTGTNALIATLPFTTAGTQSAFGLGRENAVTGILILAFSRGTRSIYIIKMDNTSIITTGYQPGVAITSFI
jgi:hypothetical protein